MSGDNIEKIILKTMVWKMKMQISSDEMEVFRVLFSDGCEWAKRRARTKFNMLVTELGQQNVREMEHEREGLSSGSRHRIICWWVKIYIRQIKIKKRNEKPGCRLLSCPFYSRFPRNECVCRLRMSRWFGACLALGAWSIIMLHELQI